jgi:hypothetical protein
MVAYTIRRVEIDGEDISREESWDPITLEMHPVGTELPKELQGRRLKISLGRRTTWLDAEGIEELKEFLDG